MGSNNGDFAKYPTINIDKNLGIQHYRLGDTLLLLGGPMFLCKLKIM